ncbi:MAG: TrmB family transcriptional regulator [Haloarculaceae archaeon]
MDEDSLDLPDTQRRIVTALVNAYQKQESPVKAAEIADATNRNPGTIRNSMGQIRSLGLAESKAGPFGGYVPTEEAFQLLGRDPLADRERTTVARDFQRITVAVERVEFTNVHHPTECRAWVTFQTPLPDLDVGDPVVVGPTPETRLGIAGEVHTVAEPGDRLLLSITRLDAPLDEE